MTGDATPRHDVTVGQSFLKLGTGEALARLIAFGATVYLARRLGADLYGSIALATAVLLYLACVTDCGLEMLGISDVARQPSQIAHFLPSLLTARVLVATVVMVLVAVVGLLWLPQPDGALLAMYALTLGSLAAGTQWVHLGLGGAGTAALARIVAEGLTALLILLLVRGPADIANAPLAQVIGQGAGALLLLRLLPAGVGKLRVTLDRAVVSSVFQRSWPLVLHALLGLAIFNSDFVFLRVFRNAATVGYYAVAYTLVSFALNLGVSYGMGLLPVMSKLRGTPDEERRLYDTAMAQVFAGGLPIAIGTTLVAPPIIAWFFGAGYKPAAVLLQVLIWSVPLALFRNVAQAALISYDRQHLMLRSVAVAAALNFALNVALIPAWGAVGAAIATIATEAVRAVLVLLFVRSIGIPFTALRRFWKAIVAAIAMTVALMLAGSLPAWATVLLGAVVYGATLSVLGGLRFRRGALPELAV